MVWHSKKSWNAAMSTPAKAGYRGKKNDLQKMCPVLMRKGWGLHGYRLESKGQRLDACTERQVLERWVMTDRKRSHVGWRPFGTRRTPDFVWVATSYQPVGRRPVANGRQPINLEILLIASGNVTYLWRECGSRLFGKCQIRRTTSSLLGE